MNRGYHSYTKSMVFGLLLASAWVPNWITIPTSQTAVGRASWIWVSPDASRLSTTDNGAVGTYELRKDFQSEGGEGRLQIAADNKARVLLNGKLVGTSDAWDHLTTIPVRTLAGKNTLVIETTNGAATGAKNPGGIVAYLTAKGTTVFTDSTWTYGRDSRPVTVLGGFGVEPWSLSPEAPAPPILRKSVQLKKTIKSATVRVIGLGDYVLNINGKRVGDTLFNQPWSQYDKTIYYRGYDVTKMMKTGENVFGAMLGNSFWNVNNPPAGRYVKGDVKPMFDRGQQYLFALECDVMFRDGSHQIIKSDTSWKWHSSPIVFSHIYAGEDYDSRQRLPGWDKPGFDDQSWSKPILAIAPKVKIEKQFWTGIRVKQIFKPAKMIQRANDRWSIDFGQNCSGTVQIEVIGKSGETVTLKPSEVMTPAGDVDQMNLWGGAALMKYTLSGIGTESWRPEFFYHGQRYVEVKGAVPAGKPNPLKLPVLKSIQLLHTREDNAPAGTFRSSNELTNRTYSLIDWAVRSNMSHVMTDCPHREKLGWLECSYLLAPTFSYMYDTRTWMEKILADIRDAQLPDGRILTTAPVYLQQPPSNAFAYTVEWGAAGVFLPWHMYEWYGDKASLARSYASMRAFTDQITTASPNYIAPAGLGDWYDYGHGKGPGPSRFTPQDLSSTATYAMCVETLVKSAQILGHKEDVKKYQMLWEEVKDAFQDKFYDAQAKTCRNNGSCQAANAFALEANLIPSKDRNAVLDNIIRDLEKRGYQQTPGDIGHVYFIRALAKAGRSDILHKVYARTGVGSYGGILAKGMTALPETWDAITTGSNSLNHCMLGHVIEWYYGYVLGVRQAEGSSGWNQIVIAPEPGPMTSISGSVVTPKGKILCSWMKERDGYDLRVTVPKGMAATIRVPKGYPQGAIVHDRHALTPALSEFQVGEGTYHIEAFRPGMERDEEEEKREREQEKKKAKGKGKDKDKDRD